MKTRLSMIFSIVLLVLLLFTACGLRVIHGSGQTSSESRVVSNFTTVTFSGVGDLTIVQGESESLTIETDDNLLPYLKTTVSQGTLTIGFDDYLWFPILRPTKSIRYTLTVKSLTGLELSGAGTIQSTRLTADHLTVANSGAGRITIEQLTASDATVTLSGVGTIGLAGEAMNQTVEMSGLGAYQAGDLASRSATITMSGAGAATVWVSERLDAQKSGAGTLSYYGSPQMSASSSGVGNVVSLGDK